MGALTMSRDVAAFNPQSNLEIPSEKRFGILSISPDSIILFCRSNLRTMAIATLF
jgi:uncharacterized phage infection (PIP) family protein YhgE